MDIATPSTSSTLSVGTIGTPSGQLYVSGVLPSSPIGSVALPNASAYTSQATSGNYNYVITKASSSSGAISYLYVYDMSSPATPTLISQLALSSLAQPLKDASAITILGNTLYIAGSTTSSSNNYPALYAFDISKPSLITNLSYSVYPVSASTWGTTISVYGDYAYVGTNGGYIINFNISNSRNIYYVSSSYSNINYSLLTPIFSPVVGAVSLGSNIYLATSDGYLVEWSVTSSHTLNFIQSTAITAGYTPVGISLNKNKIYVNTYENTSGYKQNYIYMYDLSLNPSTPSNVSSLFGCTTNCMYIANNNLYINNSFGSTYNQIFNISGASPALINSIVSPVISSYSSKGRYLYAVDYTNNKLLAYDIGGGYSQSLEVGSTETATLNVGANENIVGSSTIAGTLSVAASANVGGDISVAGSTILLNSSSTPEASSCATAMNVGSMYYDTDTTANDIRICSNISKNQTTGANAPAWTDLVTFQDLGLLAYGVDPDSGTTPGDLVGLTSGSPCMVTYFSSTQVSISPCVVYSGGQRVVVPSQTLALPTSTAAIHYIPIYIDTTQTSKIGSNINVAYNYAFADQNGSTYIFNPQSPRVTLAVVVTSAARLITNIYDTRVYTTDTKSYAAIGNGRFGLGMAVTPFATRNVFSISSTGNKISGVVADGNGNSSVGSINAIIITSGPTNIYTAGTSLITGGQYFLLPGTGGAVTSSNATANATFYNSVGVSQRTTAYSSCVTGPLGCQYSAFTNLNIR
jgi:hypothetical protein